MRGRAFFVALTLAVLTGLTSLAGCAAGGSPPSPSAGVTPGATADDPTGATGTDGEPVDEPVSLAALTPGQLCTALQTLEIEPLIGATPYEYDPESPDAHHNGCLANADAESAVTGGISASIVTGDEADDVWQQFLDFDGVIELDTLADPAIYDEDLATGFLPVVTVAMRSADGLTVLQFAPVIGAPVPPQKAATDAFVDLLDALGIPY